MCGISCILGLSPAHKQTQGVANGTSNGHDHKTETPREQLLHELDASLAQIKHRGPDASGHWISDDNRVGTLADFLSSMRYA